MAKKIPKNHVPPPVQKKKNFYKIAKNARSNDFHAVLTQKFFYFFPGGGWDATPHARGTT
jgi:hypothetical protein